MKEDFIQLKRSNILRLGIKTDEGIDTGEYLEFNLEDIELPLKYQELIEKDKKNKERLRNELLIIDKRQDVKGKKLLSKNEEDKIVSIRNFFQREIEIYNIFLGKNGVQKLLNGQELSWTSLQDIDEIIEKQITPHLKITMDDITKKVKEKYGQAVNKDKEVLK